MSNIYLRLPTYVCAFYRNRDLQHPLPLSKPVVFCDFSQEYVLLTLGARIMPDAAMARSHCYSQFAWRNMMKGRPPGGGLRIVRRDDDEWLTVQEVRTLAHEEMTAVKETCDYLCIQMPREIMAGGVIRRVTSSYSLDGKSAKLLGNMLRHEFKHNFLDWLIQDRRFCNQKGIERSRVESIERFLMTYDIPVSVDNKERESIRRMTNRWLNNAKQLLNDRIDFEDDYFKHLTDDESAQLSQFAEEQEKYGKDHTLLIRTKRD